LSSAASHGAGCVRRGAEREDRDRRAAGRAAVHGLLLALALLALLALLVLLVLLELLVLLVLLALLEVLLHVAGTHSPCRAAQYRTTVYQPSGMRVPSRRLAPAL
jgi:Flp pilus assembly protein TadB